MQKSTAERGSRQNSRGGRQEPVKQVKDSLHNVSPIRTNDALQISIVDTTKEVNGLNQSVEKVEINGGRGDESKDSNTGAVKGMKPRKSSYVIAKRRQVYVHLRTLRAQHFRSSRIYDIFQCF